MSRDLLIFKRSRGKLAPTQRFNSPSPRHTGKNIRRSSRKLTNFTYKNNQTMSTQLSTPLRRVSVLATDQVFASTLMQAKDFFHLASLRHGKQLGQGFNASFETRLVSPDSLPVGSFSNVLLPVDGGLDDADIIILPAFWGDFDTLCQRYPQVMPWLREQHARGAVLCAAATGVFWLAEASLLDGKEATTYWRFFNTFAERFPQVHLNQDKHLTDADNLYCAGGPTSACDLSLIHI